MQRVEQFVSPAQLARALAVGESTVKRWIDQGRVPAEKTPGGHRRVRMADALSFIRRTRGGAGDLAALGFASSSQVSPETLSELLCSEAPEQAAELVEQLFAQGTGAGDLADLWIAPAMEQVGARWERGAVAVTAEHRATAVLLRALHALLRAQPVAPESAPRAFVAGPEMDPYLLAPLCVQLVLNEVGFATTNFGPDTPADDLAREIRTVRPTLVALSFSSPDGGSSRGRRLLASACRESHAALVVGGRGLRPEVVDELDPTSWCRSMGDLERLARHLAQRASEREIAHAG